MPNKGLPLVTLQAFTCEQFILIKVSPFLALIKSLAPTCEGVPLNKIAGVYCSPSKYAESGGGRI